jgi:hypothetical protein
MRPSIASHRAKPWSVSLTTADLARRPGVDRFGQEVTGCVAVSAENGRRILQCWQAAQDSRFRQSDLRQSLGWHEKAGLVDLYFCSDCADILE